MFAAGWNWLDCLTAASLALNVLALLHALRVRRVARLCRTDSVRWVEELVKYGQSIGRDPLNHATCLYGAGAWMALRLAKPGREREAHDQLALRGFEGARMLAEIDEAMARHREEGDK